MRPAWSKSSLFVLTSLLACARPSTTSPAQVDAAEGADAGAGASTEPVVAATATAPERRSGTVHVDAPTLDPARVARFGAWIDEQLDDERYIVPIERDDLVFGPADARVTFTVFVDYQCPYSAKLMTELAALLAAYPADVRVVVKHFPLNMHREARPAAEAVIAAAVQGRGLAMHALVFANQRTLAPEDLLDLARQAGVPNMPRFIADVEDAYGRPQVDRDLALGQQLAVTSTPSFFINGVPQRGAKTFEQLRELVEAELVIVDRLIATGAARHEVYASFMHAGAAKRELPAKPSAQPTSQPAGKPDPSVHYAVPVDGRPSKGPDDALVTIIEFSDFECPFCLRVQTTLTELERRYGKDLRIVYRHQPLSFHKNAHDAALAAAAADRQGKFWEMHDLLFQMTAARQLGNYDALAQQLGLDVQQFQADMADPKLAELIALDQKVAAQFGATGTPAFFVNGRYFSGAQPIENFAALIDEELRAAKAYKAKHKVAGDKLYASMSRDWETQLSAPPIAEHSRQTISVKDLPATGKTNKPAISIVGCIDFDCPYCSRGAAMIEQVLATKPYADKVGYYALNFPLPMHANAEGAHRAAIAAGEQGKFWEMHALLYADIKRRSMPEYEAMATQLGLDLDKFRADWASQATTDKLTADKAVCTKLGVTGTPTYFVNGRKTRGAIPFDMMATVLDEELAGGFEAAAKKKPKK
jgi:protein-disulfide isomerase